MQSSSNEPSSIQLGRQRSPRLLGRSNFLEVDLRTPPVPPLVCAKQHERAILRLKSSESRLAVVEHFLRRLQAEPLRDGPGLRVSMSTRSGKLSRLTCSASPFWRA